jgi:hypothetical protein
MARGPSVMSQRRVWALLVGAIGLLCWVVAIGVGARAWILVEGGRGIVAHVEAFGRDAMPWMITGAILLLTAAVMGVGIAVVRHLTERTGTPTLPTQAVQERKEPKARAAASVPAASVTPPTTGDTSAD